MAVGLFQDGGVNQTSTYQFKWGRMYVWPLAKLKHAPTLGSHCKIVGYGPGSGVKVRKDIRILECNQTKVSAKNIGTLCSYRE